MRRSLQIEYSDHQYPVEVVVKGDNLDSLHVAIDSIHHRLSKNKDIDVLTTTFGTTGNRLEVTLKPEEANRVGMSKSLLSLNFALRYGGGIPVTTIWEGDHELGIEANISDDAIVDPQEYQMPHLTALENRTETQLLDTWVEKSEIEKKIARASMQPMVLLGGTANYSKLLAEWHSKAIAFATVQIPISAFWRNNICASGK